MPAEALCGFWGCAAGTLHASGRRQRNGTTKQKIESQNKYPFAAKRKEKMGNYINQVRLSFEHFPKDERKELKQDTVQILRKLDVPISLFYYYCLGKVKTDGVSMITVYFTSDVKQDKSINGNDLIYCYFDEKHFSELKTDAEKKEFYVETIHKALLFLADTFNWEKINFEKVKNLILENNFIFRFYCDKGKTSPNRQIAAQIYVETDFALKKLKFYAVFKTKEKEIKTLFTHTGEGVGMIEYIVNKVQWADNKTVRVEMENGDYWTATIEGRSKFHCIKAEQGNAHVQYNLGLMYLNGQNVIKNTDEAIYWLEKSAGNGFKKAQEMLKQINL